MTVLERYSRQVLLKEIGKEGQERLCKSSVAVIGCGALGTVIASTVVRAGVGRVRIVDRDYVELSNLQRQVLFDEEDISRGLPKAIAAAEKLKRINSDVLIEPVVTDVNPGNVQDLIRDVDLILDGTDNFETRFLINDASAKHCIPWVYGAVVDTYGMTMTIVPQRTPCFRCLLSELPPPGSRSTCDTVGVLATAVNIVASLEVTEGIKLLLGREHVLCGKLVYVDAWNATLDQFEVHKRDTPCRVCDEGSYDFLEGRAGTYASALCGRDAVQLNLRGESQVSFSDLARQLERVGEVAYSAHMLRFRVEKYELNLFPDGRAIVKGTTDMDLARSLYARYIGT